MTEMVLLGDEAVAVGAIHAGLSAAYAYPGTPSTEIVEYLLHYKKTHSAPHASWCANEKTAYEEGVGVSYVGKRALVAMKHVGLNVAADPFINSALVSIHGGLVLAVADDPGMHSSQDEQDSRFYADFARTICLEPTSAQEAYDMTREAFDLSEKFKIPVMLRLVTRLAHSRAVVNTRDPIKERPVNKALNRKEWSLLPANARVQWHRLLERQKDFEKYSEENKYTLLHLNNDNHDVGVITTGLGKNYYLENVDELKEKPSHLHIGSYPLPTEKIRTLAKHVKKLVIIEEGYPFLERQLRGILPNNTVTIVGKLSGHVPLEGELTPDNVRSVLGLSEKKGQVVKGLEIPGRPPQLCRGCPHCDTFDDLKKALTGYSQSLVTSDIGCYTLGALPPYSAIESCLCMGASIGMAKGAAEAGMHPVVAVIGDSTFLHSGVTPLMDAAAFNANMTLIIVDNESTAMTGTQDTLLPPERFESIILGIGVNPEHLHIITPLKKNSEQNVRIIKQELDYKGLSVIISRRTCIEALKHKKRS